LLLHFDLVIQTPYWACFINCSQEVVKNSWYKPVNCLSANNSFVYVMTNDDYYGCNVSSLEPSCGYWGHDPLW